VKRFGISFLLFLGCAGSLVAQPNGEAFVDSVLAIPYNDMVRDLPHSQAVFQRALSDARSEGRPKARAELHRQLAVITGLSGQLDSSTYHSLAAADLFRQLGDPLPLGIMLCDLGHGLKRRDLARAFVYYREGISILEGLDAQEALTRAYNNYAPLHELNGDIDSALYFARKGLVLVEAQQDSVGLPYSLNRVATYLLFAERFEEARDLMLRADTIRRITNDEHGLADQQVYFGDLYQSWGRIEEAIPYFEEGTRQARAMDLPYLEQYCHERLAECREKLGDAGAALHHTRRAFAIKDSLFNESNSKVMLELEQRYAVAEKDRAIALLNERAARRQFYIWLSLIALVLVLVSGLYLHQVRQRRLRGERDAAIIREREAGLKAVFHATEAERRRLARELHDGVGQQLGGLKHRLEHLRTQGDADAVNETITIVDDTAREVRDLAHQLMPKALSRLGLVPALEDLVQRTFSGTAITASFEPFAVPDELPVDMATGLYRITQELLNNILKHAQASTVEVQLLSNRGHLVLIVQDNGRGVQAANAAPGIGLLNIADRVRALNCTFALESTPGQGTAATVRVPLAPST